MGIRKGKQSIEEKLKQDVPTPEQIEEEKCRIALLEKSIKSNDELLVNLDELKILEAKVSQERDAENQATAEIQEEIIRLGSLL